MKMTSLLVAAFIVMMCASRPRPYGVTVNNKTSGRVTDARVSYGNFSFLAGVIPPGAQKGQGVVTVPVPARATVEWRTSDGVLHVKGVAVKAAVPEGFAGDITFQILDHDQVRVSAGSGS